MKSPECIINVLNLQSDELDFNETKRYKRTQNILKRILQALVVRVLLAFAGCTPSEPKQLYVSDPRYLIITADDLCATKRVTYDIIKAYKNGIVTTASALMNFPHSIKMLKEIHRNYPDLPIGLHLNVTEGRPASDLEMVPTLVDENGYFHNADGILKHLLDISLDEIRIEFNAQVERFFTTGVPLDHIDYHNHMMALYTPFYKIVRKIAKKYNVAVRNPVPISAYKKIKIEKGGGASKAIWGMIWFAIKHPFIAWKLRKSYTPRAFEDQYKKLKQEDVACPDWFIDSFYENISVGNLLSILEELLPGVSELMTHPGKFYKGQIVSKELDSNHLLEGESELEILTNKVVKTKIEELNIKLVTYSFLRKHLKK